MPTTMETPLPLESGDRLTREEFHRRYCARPDIKKAELIRGRQRITSRFGGRELGWPLGDV